MAVPRGLPAGQSARDRALHSTAPLYLCEADVAAGLETIARQEIEYTLGERARLRQTRHPGRLVFTYSGDLTTLTTLGTVLAVYLVQHFPIPRPGALLGDQHFRALLQQIAAVRTLAPRDSYATLYLSAAGANSSILTRLKEELARHTGLAIVSPVAGEGDLLLRLRPAIGGWETLVRLGPRPLSARPWRVCNREGALNATVARAMAWLTNPDPLDHVLNIGCGSGTLLIERAHLAEAGNLLGYDTDHAALACARENVSAAGLRDRISLRHRDARVLALPDASIDVLLADLPFGHLVGSHEENVALYPALLHEATRVARSKAAFVLITHEVRLTEALLRASRDWVVEQVLRVALGGLNPRIFLLQRR